MVENSCSDWACCFPGGVSWDWERRTEDESDQTLVEGNNLGRRNYRLKWNGGLVWTTKFKMIVIILLIYFSLELILLCFFNNFHFF